MNSSNRRARHYNCGSDHPKWNGGRRIDKDGYVVVFAPDNPMTRKNRYVLEHRINMARHLGRNLKKHEVVHHKNGDRQDNRIENLEVFSNNTDHLAHELKGRCPKWTEDGKRRLMESYERHRIALIGIRKVPLASDILKYYYETCGLIVLAIAWILHTSPQNVAYWMKHHGIERDKRKVYTRLTPLGVTELGKNPLALKAYARSCKQFYLHLKKLFDTEGLSPSETAYEHMLKQAYPRSTRLHGSHHQYCQCGRSGPR